jgi:beta-lactamase class A
MRRLQSSIDQSVFREHDARWSIAVVEPESGNSLAELDADISLASASIGKMLALIELAHRIHNGEADPRTRIRRSDADSVGDSGLWQHLLVDEMCLADIGLFVGALSDNLATNVLLRYLGLESVQQRGELLGLKAVQLHDRVRGTRTSDDPPHLSSGSARELAELMRQLALDAGSRSAEGSVGGRVLSWLEQGSDLSMVASAFGLDPLAHATHDRGVRLWNKTGTDPGVRADVGLIEGPHGRVTYAVLVNWSEAASADDGSRDLVLEGMRQIGMAIRSVVAELPAEPGP